MSRSIAKRIAHENRFDFLAVLQIFRPQFIDSSPKGRRDKKKSVDRFSGLRWRHPLGESNECYTAERPEDGEVFLDRFSPTLPLLFGLLT